ncbi:MAG: LysR family transcriptional regulator [Myxococcota bacterium]
MEWSDLRLFLAIARAGTLGAAGRAVGQSQPTMGRRLRALEATLGHRLFQRTPAGFVPTDEGAALRVHAERIEDEVLAIRRELAGVAQELEGTLRITASEWFAGTMLAPVLATFAERHPRVVVELLADARLLNLSRRDADLAFRIRPFDEPDVVSRRLVHVRYAAYVRRGSPHPTAGDGAGSAMILLDAGFGGVPDDSWLPSVLPAARVGFRSNSRDLQARMCERGLGVAVLPIPLAERSPELERVDLGEAPGRDTWLGYHRDLRQLARLRALVEHVVAAFERPDPPPTPA